MKLKATLELCIAIGESEPETVIRNLFTSEKLCCKKLADS